MNDDAFALHYLFTHGHYPSMITTCSGNTLSSDSAADAESLLKAYQLQLPGGVQQGPDHPMGWSTQIREAHRTMRREHGATLHLGELGSDRALSEAMHSHTIDYSACPPDSEITYLALGPLGNLSAALDAGVISVDRIDHLVFSGGAFTTAGNVGPYAEFNVFADPLAAAKVLGAGLRRITIVPLEVTAKVTYGIAEFERISATTAVFAKDLKRTKQDEFRTNPDFREPIWDLVAAIVLFQPEVILRSQRATVAVDCGPGETLGATSILALDSDSSIEIVLEVDEDAIRRIMCQCAQGGLR
ncbi:nucleoside hydrolase [Streptomyces sp. NPDC004752]